MVVFNNDSFFSVDPSGIPMDPRILLVEYRVFGIRMDIFVVFWHHAHRHRLLKVFDACIRNNFEKADKIILLVSVVL
jgi:hypothetical protein